MDTLTLRQAATRLNKSERTIRGMIASGRLSGEKVSGPSGSEWRISVEDVERLAEVDLPHPPAPPEGDLPEAPAPSRTLAGDLPHPTR